MGSRWELRTNAEHSVVVAVVFVFAAAFLVVDVRDAGLTEYVTFSVCVLAATGAVATETLLVERRHSAEAVNGTDGG